MKLETNPKRVEKLATQREEENMKFRYFLKNGDLKPSKIDKKVHHLNDEISRQIDCCACANCCIKTTTEVSLKDLHRMARVLGKPRDEFVKAYLDFNEEEKSYWLKGPPCPFLVEKKCSVYEARPDICRSFPHLHKKDFTGRLLGVVENCSVCPIVLNVFERLKEDLWDESDNVLDEETSTHASGDRSHEAVRHANAGPLRASLGRVDGGAERRRARVPDAGGRADGARIWRIRTGGR